MFILVVEGKGTVVFGRQAWRGVGVGGGDGGGGVGGGQDCWTAFLFDPSIAVLLPLNPVLDVITMHKIFKVYLNRGHVILAFLEAFGLQRPGWLFDLGI